MPGFPIEINLACEMAGHEERSYRYSDNSRLITHFAVTAAAT